MKILLINSVCGVTSTGKICTGLAELYEVEGHECKIAYGREMVPEKYNNYAIKIGTAVDAYVHALSTRIFDNVGFMSVSATKRFLKWADEYDPDLLWIHNLHGYYINIELLFNWIKSRPSMQVKWTLHDCWAFTGHCPYFEIPKCDKWKTGCYKCPTKTIYPQSYVFDRSRKNYKQKKEIFTGVKNMTLITPSQWLSDLVKESFLREYPVEVIHNTVNKEVFYPHESSVREKYGIGNKKMILGVANGFDDKKGLSDFIELSKLISKDTVIVMIGLRTQNDVDRLPWNIIAMTCTNNQQELSDFYAAADVFFNPTYQDNFPTVNLEAEACGTPVITYDVGGCKETITRNDSVAISQGCYREVINYIRRMH